VQLFDPHKGRSAALLNICLHRRIVISSGHILFHAPFMRWLIKENENEFHQHDIGQDKK
jgi:hypothetical protein